MQKLWCLHALYDYELCKNAVIVVLLLLIKFSSLIVCVVDAWLKNILQNLDFWLEEYLYMQFNFCYGIWKDILYQQELWEPNIKNITSLISEKYWNWMTQRIKTLHLLKILYITNYVSNYKWNFRYYTSHNWHICVYCIYSYFKIAVICSYLLSKCCMWFAFRVVTVKKYETIYYTQ